MAAVAAGMRCVGVGTTMSAERLRGAGAAAVVASLDWSIPDVRGFFE
jgi:beta-phosphoglucomutase-like phosphatase (HAD superfamily)